MVIPLSRKRYIMRTITIKRGQIYYADLSPVIGAEQGGLRPVLIIQNDIGNRHSPTTIIAPITSRLDKHSLPTHIECKILRDSIILCEQIRIVDKRRLKNHIATLDEDTMVRVNEAIKISLGV